MQTMASVWKRARANASVIVLPEGDDKRIVEAAGIAEREGLARPVLVGKRPDIEALAKEVGADLGRVMVADPQASEALSAYSSRLYERRKHKGMTPTDALDLARCPMYFGALMVAAGDADGIIAGAATTTADVLRAFIISMGTAEGVTCVSSAFLVVLSQPDGSEKAFVFADASVVPDPTPEELASIAVASARTMKRLTGQTPYVAMLSFSTKGSAKHPSIDKVIEATELARMAEPDIAIDGELQADAAIVPEIAMKKAPGSDVAGRANVLVFPNLDAANIGYKLVERLAGARAFGPILQGLARPASDLSRGCSTDDVVNTIAMTGAQKAPV
jgi:phosphate acetyltransferase